MLCAAVVLAPFIFLSTPLAPWKNPASIVSLAQEGVYPIESAWQAITQAVGNSWTNYTRGVEAAKENTMLRRELSRLQTRIMDYEEQVLENVRLRRLLGFTKRIEKRLVAAEVVNIGGLPPFQSLRVARGASDGVKVGFPVVAADGVVGRVIRVGLNYSDVQLLVDAQFKLDVLLQRTRVRGVLSGAALDQARLQLHKRADIRIGDTIITSGIVGGFPKGLPVGRVMRITYESEHVAQTISVEPWLDYRRLEEVMILFHTDQELQKIIETAGSEWLDQSLSRAAGG